MKKIKTFIGIAVHITIATGFSYQDNWYLLKSDEYKIEFPVKPVPQTQMIKSEIGELKMDIFMHDASENEKDENLVYGFMYTEYPDSLINSGKTELLTNFFRNAIDGSLGNVKGKLLSETIIEIDKFPGREIKIEFMEGLYIMKMRFYLVRNKMYIIQTITDIKKTDNKSAERFMGSFGLISKQE